VVEDIGDPAKIGAGAARMTKNPRDLNIAAKCAEVITASRRFKDGFSFQTGVGAIPIAATIYLSEKMEEQGIKASFTLGGTTSNMVDMFRKGRIRVIESSQSFDAVAARAIIEEPNIVEIDNALYADPYTKGSILSKLDFGLLAALEVDTDFNVNILTGSSGEMMAGMGGGPDVAADAAVSIVVVPIVRGRTPSITKRVFTCCTPGDTIAMVITEAGIALNPKYPLYEELKEDLEKTNLKLVTIEELQQLAESLCGTPKPIETTDKVCVVVEYRDGTVIDVIRQIKK
jgi:citrate lyase subunit alpha/citrate CoA-transferase